MRPAHKTISAGVWMSSRVGLVFKLQKPLFIRASEPGPSTNLAFQTTSEELQELFAQAGTVQSASVVEDRDTGRSRGFGFVEMSSNEEAAAAIDQFNGKEVNGRALKVNEAKPRENRGGGGRGFSGGRGGFGGNRGGNRGGNYGGHREPRW